MKDEKKIEKLTKQLEIAIKVLEYYKNKSVCQKALTQIRALDRDYSSKQS